MRLIAKICLTLLLSCILIHTISSQEEFNCGFDVILRQSLQADLSLETVLNSFNLGGGNCDPVSPPTRGYTIPVVVHIIHNGGPENISNEQVLNAIDLANQQLAGEEGGHDTQIRLALATADPDGNCTNGIVRISSSLTDFDEPLTPTSDLLRKNLSRWSPFKYLNVWVLLDLPGTIGGYAIHPPVSGVTRERDGIVIQYNYFGNTAPATANRGFSFVHEIGHYLSLYHTWGCESGQTCGQDWSQCHPNDEGDSNGDFVCDTPAMTSYSGCDTDRNSCDFDELPDPVENYMSYGFGCALAFTEGQAFRMYRLLNDYREELWSNDNLACTGAGGNLGVNVTISENTEWTTSNLPNGGKVSINGKLTILPGSTLTVGAGVEINFCNFGKVEIHPNANLILSGKLTSPCGLPWQGVEVWGSFSLSNTGTQYSINGDRAQGRLVGTPGSSIENAELAVQLWGPDDNYNSGGQISVNGTIFRNNKIAVEFRPFTNTWPFSFPTGSLGQPRSYFARFTACQFITDESYNNEEDFQVFVKMAGVEGVSFIGCTFTNSYIPEGANQIEDFGVGIQLFSAGFRMQGLCNSLTYPCLSYQRNSFSGLGYGVEARNALAGTKPYTVTMANFENCYVGIYNDQVHAATFLFNEFKLGEVPINGIVSEQFGIQFTGEIDGFTCQENRFVDETQGSLITCGILCENIRSFDNLIRRNTYSGLDFGNESKGNNGASFSGLHYLCNEFVDMGTNDMRFPFSVSTARIRRNQGLGVTDEFGNVTYLPAGNVFSYDVRSIANSQNEFRYYQYPMGVNEPLFGNTSNVEPLNVNTANSCPEEFCEPPCLTRDEVEQFKIKYGEDKSKENAALIAWETAIQNNDTNEAILKELEVSYYQKQVNEDAFMVVLHILHDTVMFHPDTLYNWLEKLDGFGLNLAIVAEQNQQGNQIAVERILNKITNREDLLAMDDEDLKVFPGFLGILGQTSPLSLSQPQLRQLEYFADRTNGEVGHFSRNILRYYGYSFPRQQLNSDKTNQINPATDSAVNSREVIVYPNPSSGQLSFYCSTEQQDLELLQLRITDIHGKVLFEKRIPAGQTTELDLRRYPNGLYFYTLIAGDKMLKSDKLILQR